MIGAPPSDPSVGLVLSHQDVDKDWLRTCAAVPYHHHSRTFIVVSFFFFLP
jgi:hypothetical protein